MVRVVSEDGVSSVHLTRPFLFPSSFYYWRYQHSKLNLPTLTLMELYHFSHIAVTATHSFIAQCIVINSRLYIQLHMKNVSQNTTRSKFAGNLVTFKWHYGWRVQWTTWQTFYEQIHKREKLGIFKDFTKKKSSNLYSSWCPLMDIFSSLKKLNLTFKCPWTLSMRTLRARRSILSECGHCILWLNCKKK